MVDRVIKLEGRGLRGESFADIARRTGQYGVVPGDDDADVLTKITAGAESAADQARAWAESATAPGVEGSRSAKSWAGQAAISAAAALAFIGGIAFADTTAGLAAVNNGDYFSTIEVGQDDAATIYLKAGGSAVEQTTLISTQGVDNRIAAFAPVRDAPYGNFIFGSPTAGGDIVNGFHSDGHVTGSLTGFGLGQYLSVTTSYACDAFGAGALRYLETGHSTSALSYQALHHATNPIACIAIGVDAGFNSTAPKYTIWIGRHSGNLADYAGEGSIFIGEQTARYFTSGDNIIGIGRNVFANAPATGSAHCLVAGSNSAIKTAVATSVLLGEDIMQSQGAGTRTAADSFHGGYRNSFGILSSESVASVGAYGFFQADNDNTALSQATGLGAFHGQYVAGSNNLFLGFRAAAHVAKTTLNGVVCIGPQAGDVGLGANALNDNDFVLANSYIDSRRLMTGNFVTQQVNFFGLVTVDGPVDLRSYTVAQLSNILSPSAGMTVFCTNARNDGEGAAAGTGSLVAYDGTNWKVPGISGAVAA